MKKIVSVLLLFHFSIHCVQAQYPEHNGLEYTSWLSLSMGVEEGILDSKHVYRAMSCTSLGLRYWFQVSALLNMQYYDGIDDDPVQIFEGCGLLATLPYAFAENKMLLKFHAGPLWSVSEGEKLLLQLSHSHVRTMVEIDHYRWFSIRASRDWPVNNQYAQRNEVFSIFKVWSLKKNGDYLLGLLFGLIAYQYPVVSSFSGDKLIPQIGLSFQPY